MGGTSILVVDDEPAVLLTYSMIFRQSGYDVTGVATASEAKAVLEERSFDLLVCDLALETGRSGLEVLDFARSRYSAMPAILLTGYGSRELAEEADRRRLTLLYKPIEVNELLETISQLTRARTA